MINKSPFSSSSLDSCIKFAEKGSPILLFEDGVYAAVTGTSLESKISGIANDFDLYALKEDLMLRGIADKIMPGVKQIDYAGFVELVEQHKTASWA